MRFIASLSFGLLLLALTACQSSDTPATPSSTEEGAAAATTTSGLHIVYIDADSLQNGYISLRADLSRLEENYAAAEANHQSRVNSLQSEVQGLQNRIQRGELSQNAIGQQQQRIARREQEIMQQQQLALNSIQEEQIRLQGKFATEVEDILEALKTENGYDFIFNIGSGSGLLMANEGYEITELVLERLNAAPTTTPATEEEEPASEE